VSGLLLPISDNGTVKTFKTADDSFAKILFNSSTNVWDVWTKDGTHYVFGGAADSLVLKTHTTNGCVTAESNLNLPYRWQLASVTNTNNQTLSYNYFEEAKAGCTNEIAAYPDTITYPVANTYRVHFVRDGTRRSDYQNSWTVGTAMTLYGTYRLDKVSIEQYSGGSWNSIRDYDFSYYGEGAANSIFPNFTFTHGGHVLSLQSVVEKSGTASLRPTTFTYGDNMHLTKVDNGYGGSVTMAYERWRYFDDVNKGLYSSQVYYGPGKDWCKNGTSTNHDWTKISGPGSVRCGSTNNAYMQIGASGQTGTTVAHRAIPEFLNKPGGLYLFYINVADLTTPHATTITWGLSNEATNPDTDVDVGPAAYQGYTGAWKGMEGFIDYPATWNPSQVKMRLACVECYMEHFEFGWLTFWRVSSRTVSGSTDPNYTDLTYTYHYDNGAPNSKDNSADVAGIPAANLYTPALKENRGYGMTQAVDPNGLASVTWFGQDDRLKGRPYQTLTLLESFFDDFDHTPGSNPNAINPDWWTTGGSGTYTTGELYQVDFGDYAEESTNTAADFSVSLTRTGSISSGHMVVAHLRLSQLTGGSTPSARARLVSGSNVFGVEMSQAGGIVLTNGPTLIAPADFHLDEWYVLELFLDDAGPSRARVWQENDPSKLGEATLDTPDGLSWSFVTHTKSGTLWLDAYFEGVPYSASTMTYTATTTYDTIAGGSISDIVGLSNWHDLRVYQVTMTSTEQRLYDQDATWDGTLTTYAYDTDANPYVGYGNQTQQIEYGCPGGVCSEYRRTVTTYNPNASTYVVGLPARQEVEDSGGTTVLSDTLLFYDGATSNSTPPTTGNLTTQRTWVDGPLDSGRYSQISYGYDLSYGNQTSVTAYDAYGTSASAPTSGSRTTTTAYDSSYHTYRKSQTTPPTQNVPAGLVATWKYDYDGNGTDDFKLDAPTSETDPNGITASATYDAFGRITGVSRSDDPTYGLTMSYNDDDPDFTPGDYWTLITQRVDGSQTFALKRHYDGVARQMKVETGSMVSGSFIVANTVVDQYPSAHQQTVSMPYAAGESAAYTVSDTDSFGRTLKVTTPDGEHTDYSYNGLTSTAQDANRNSTVTVYDVWGRTMSVTPPTGPNVAYTYDLFGRLLTATRGGVTTAVKYDQAGRKIGMDDPDLGYAGTTGDDTWAWRYAYDAIGNMTAQTGPRGYPAQDCTVTISYDLLNRPTNKNSTGACDQGQGQLNIVYTYDQGTNNLGQSQRGFRTGMTDYSGSSTWTYDSRGNMLSELKTVVGTQYSSYWTYNQAGLPINMVYPDGETVTYGYNALMQLKTLTSSLANYVIDTSYDAASRVTGRSLGSGMTQAFTYYNWTDKTTVDGQLVGQGGRLHFLTAGTLQNYTYSYDATGNIRTIFSNADGSVGSADDQTQSFTYDSLDRVTSAGTNGDPNTGGYSEIYDYDSTTGNLAHKAGQLIGYYPTDRPHAPTNDSDSVYTYTGGGDMVYRHTGQNKTIAFYYDAEERLIQATSSPGNGLMAIFIYDGDSRRVQSTINGTTTTFVGGYYEKTGSTVTKYYYAGGSRIAMRQAGTLYYLLNDHLSSTNITTDANGGKVAELRYKAWGEVRFSSGATPTRYTYTGQYDYTADFGLMYYNARWYSPTLSHFSQPDTVVSSGVQGMDRYAFVDNSPVVHMDPSGHCEESDDLCRRQLSSSLPVANSAANEPALTAGGNEVMRLYRRMRSQTTAWWYTGDVFTTDQFVGLLLMTEGKDNPTFMSLNDIAGAQQLYVGANDLQPYCPSGLCINGAFNYLSTLQSVNANLLTPYVKGNGDVTQYRGCSGCAGKTAGDIMQDADTYAKAMLDPERYGNTIMYPVPWPLNKDANDALSQFSSNQTDLVADLLGEMNPNQFYPGGYKGIYYFTADGSVWYSTNYKLHWSH